MIIIVGTMYAFTVFTTGLLQWYSKPYVHKLKFDPPSQRVELEYIDFWSRRHRMAFTLQEAVKATSMHPYAQFAVNGREFQVRIIRLPSLTLSHITLNSSKTYFQNHNQ